MIMKNEIKKLSKLLILFLIIGLNFLNTLIAQSPQNWQLIVPAKLPNKEVTVIPLDIQSRPMHQFILEQPNKENKCTVTAYLYDKLGADGIMEFELYYIPRSPKEVGLDLPWKK